MNFKLLAIRPLDGCSNDVLNILKVDTTYYFDVSYIYDEEKKYLIKKADVSELPNDFFYKKEIENSTLSYVNIQAIVGKNGSGKSSIIELLLRILNNFFKQYRLSEATDNLVYSKGVKAELFYLRNNRIYKIFVDTTGLNNYELKKDNLFKEPIIDIEFYDSLKSDPIVLKDHLTKKSGIRDENFIELEVLFFSMYINYSLYGLDSNNFINETFLTNIKLKENLDNLDDISWLDSIIHKNDSYQTPVVIHPYREEAQINVRNEKELLKQRLVSLIIIEKDYIQLSEKIFFKSLKLVSVRKELFSEKIYDILNLTHKEESMSNKNLRFIDSLNFDKTKLTENQFNNIDKLYERCQILNSKYNLLNKFNDNIPNDFELYYYLLKYLGQSDTYNEKDFKNSSIRDNLEIEILNGFENDYQIKLRYLFTFFSKLNIEQYKQILILDIYYNFWLEELNIKDPFNDEFEKSLFEYIVVKSQKTSRYPKYHQFVNSKESLDLLFNNFQLSDNVSENYNRFLKQLIKDTSHVSIKLHQAITMLTIKEKEVYKLYRAWYADGKNTEVFDTLDIETLRNAIVKTIEETNIEPVYLIPPPIFALDIQVSSDNSEAVHTIKKLSSGEFQLISMISSIIYHLKNLDSVKEENYEGKNYTEQIFQYRNVNVILDEIELYFHPEFQRDFIYEIIERLKNITFKSIEAISFLFITHSPFILSDIPSQNVLKLDKGLSKLNDEFNSFGANIYDLLKDEFFMKGHYIGKLSFNIIEKLIKEIKENNINHNTEKIIELIGEPILKNKLKEMIFPLLNKMERIKETERKIKELEKEITNLKNS